MNLQRLARRVEINFAACQGMYWVGFCAVSGFVTVYLSHRGLSNTQIGLTTSFGSAMAIILQLVMSNVLDRRPDLRIKRLIALLLLIGVAAAGVTSLLPRPEAPAEGNTAGLPLLAVLMILSYATCYAMGQSTSGYLNAQLVQFNNVGVPARYGWPRGVGSFCYAVAAYVYGRLVAHFDPDILIPCYILGTAVCIVCVLLMPDPNAGKDPAALRTSRQATSYREMLSGNPTLIVLLLCILMDNAGNMAGYTFILRVVERVGAGTVEYGVSEFIRAAAEVPALLASGLLLKHFKPGKIMTVAFLCYGLRTLMLALAPAIGMVYAASAFNVVCVGLSTFASVIFVNSIVRDTEKVRGQSLCMLCGSIGSIIGSAYAGAMIDYVSLTAMLMTSAMFSFVAFVVMALFCRPEKHRVAA